MRNLLTCFCPHPDRADGLVVDFDRFGDLAVGLRRVGSQNFLDQFALLLGRQMPTTNVLGDYIGSGSFVISNFYRAISRLDTGFYAGALTISPSLGIIFGLFVGFRAAQVWSDSARAEAAVEREASALRTVTLFAAALPAEMQNRLRSQVPSYIAVRLRGEVGRTQRRDLSFTKVQLAGEVDRFLPLFKR